MINSELALLHTRIQQAVNAEDLFGTPTEVPLDDAPRLTMIVKEIFRRLAKVAHPDNHKAAEDKELADETFTLLNFLYQNALKKIDMGRYGSGMSDEVAQDNAAAFRITTAKRQYNVTHTLAQGDLATVYGGYCSGSDPGVGDIVVKVVDDPADNDLLRNEIRMLKLFNADAGIYSKHLPTLLDEFKSSDGHAGMIARKLDGYDLYSVREKHPNGIDPRHIIWVFRRCLSALGYAHSKGIIHGNLEPAHILIRAKDHNIFVVDWCYAIYKPGVTGQGFHCLNEDYSPPEVEQRKPPLPSSDLYSLAKCMIFLLGGNIADNTMPDAVDDRIQRFIRFFIKPSPIQRAQDAWEMYHKLDQLRREVYGPHQFIEFKM